MIKYGKLAKEFGYLLPIQVLQSAAGFYIGTIDEDGPVSHESLGYYPTKQQAEQDFYNDTWVQGELQ